MDRSIEPVPAQVRILPPKRRSNRRSSQPFVLDGEVKPPLDPDDESLQDERPVGHKDEDEAGRRLDVTA